MSVIYMIKLWNVCMIGCGIVIIFASDLSLDEVL